MINYKKGRNVIRLTPGGFTDAEPGLGLPADLNKIVLIVTFGVVLDWFSHKD